MTVAERILQQISALPQHLQVEVLDFVEYLESKVGRERTAGDDAAWRAMSLSEAMRGMESEPSPYSADDLREQFT